MEINMVFLWYGLMGLLMGIVALYTYFQWKKEERKSQLSYYILGLGLLICLGLFVRFFKADQLPGLQIDEAMAGYDSWSLANFGKDSALNKWPVYLVSYGTGQSALYAYLSAPFIKLFGLSVVSIRLAMAIVSSGTLLFASWTAYRLSESKRWTFLSILLFVINPWNILISRFGLDANLAPNFLLVGICLLLWGIQASDEKKRLFCYIGTIFFVSLTAYAYISSWMLLPFLCIGISWLLIKNQWINWKQLAILGGVLFVLIVPILLFAYNQFFGVKAYSFLGLTIPKMPGTQLEGQSIFNDLPLFTALAENIKNIFSFIFISHVSDGLIFNSIPGFGVFYYGGLFFFILGCPILWRKQSPLAMLIKCWLISCLPLILISKPLVHHWNLVFFPVLITMVYGVEGLIVKLSKRNQKAVLAFFAVIFLAFQYSYHFIYVQTLRDSGYVAPVTLDDIIENANQRHLDKITVFTETFPQAGKEFIYIRFYDPVSPDMWQKTRDEPYDLSTNLTEKKYANYEFSDTRELELVAESGTGYIIHKGSSIQLPKEGQYQGYENEDYYFVYFE